MRGCRAAMIDRWLRVTCHGDGKQRPEALEVTRGGGDGMTFAVTQPGRASLVLPFEEGVDVRATFTFASSQAELRVSWPRGAAPTSKGVFIARE